MGILSKAQRAALQRALAASNEVLPKIELIERIAELSPAYAERAAELRARRDYMNRLAAGALELDDQMGK